MFSLVCSYLYSVLVLPVSKGEEREREQGRGLALRANLECDFKRSYLENC